MVCVSGELRKCSSICVFIKHRDDNTIIGPERGKARVAGFGQYM